VSEHDGPPPLPELLAGEYLLDALREAGTFTQTVGGILPLTWLELRAYILLTGAIGADWENRLVMMLSREYVDGYNIGLDPAGKPPFGDGKTGPIIAAGLFASLKAAKNGD